MPRPPLVRSSCIRSRTPHISIHRLDVPIHAYSHRLSSTDSRRISSRSVSFFLLLRYYGTFSNIVRPCVVARRVRLPSPLSIFLVSPIKPCHVYSHSVTAYKGFVYRGLTSPAIPFLIASKPSRSRFLAPLCRGATHGFAYYGPHATSCMLDTPRS